MGMTAREAALEVLTACRKSDAWADGALKNTLARSGLSQRDAALASRLTYSVLQNRMLLDHYLSGFCRNGGKDLEPVIWDILRIGACQILLMDKIPPSAAVNEAVNMAKAHHRARAAGMVNAVLRNLSRGRESLTAPKELSLRFSHPQWLVDRYVALLGEEEAEQCLQANNSEAATTIQRNPLRADQQTLESRLAEEGVAFTPHPWMPGCYTVSGTGNLEQLESFCRGYFTVQDAAARLMAMAAGCRPGDRVIDMCAAPGGKSFAAAMAMENQGDISACDIHPHKLELIRRGAERLGITCIVPVLSDGRILREEWAGSADVVLCDVPCSGLGIIRKKPDIRYKDPGAFAALPGIQLSILCTAAQYVRPGGTLVYSTCTVLPEENGQVVEAFLGKVPGFSLQPFAVPGHEDAPGQLTLWPHRHACDGFYIAKLRKEHD